MYENLVNLVGPVKKYYVGQYLANKPMIMSISLLFDSLNPNNMK